MVTTTRTAGPPAVRRERSRAASIGLHALLLSATAIALFPIMWIVLTSLKPRDAWRTSTVQLFSDPSLDNYVQLLTTTDFLRWFANSVIVATGTMVFGVFVSATTGYALSRFRFPGMRPLLWSLLVTQMFPVAILIVPLYNVLASLGLINNHGGLMLAYLTVAVPFCAWMMRGYFNTIPVEIDEAGRVDGLSPFGTFWRLIVPLARPGLAVTAFYSFVTAWGEVAYASAFMISNDNYTLARGLQLFVGQHMAEWGLLTAASVLIAVPAALVFLVVQRNLVTGLTAGANKA
ncbi:sugar ABC transporter permease [Allonocardiopsis opalescens]|uniref:Arabinogalactan oligomer/maltooligosaccharide transport system permease protein n=1 Tax=Allonocardiopsis opalescens TaxID=1144618 RepID=A0A2T0Q208_9ACTN|nr:carbohydrate ABC transporter permease [Allonocardiopsis opalescens]PRX97811.1 arabinogalactan oligomer/maltooligosaccharide transport system permease protein [Allonocardiopsis opalescens]